MKYNPDKLYVIGGRELNQVVYVAKRLYSEQRLASEEYRDLAQRLQPILDDAAFALNDGE